MGDEPAPATLREATRYVKAIVPPRSGEIAAMEAAAQEEHFPIIGPACGQQCYQVTRMIGARRVFELGSGFGYSTYWFARGVMENGGGTVHHVVWDEALSGQARIHLEKAGVASVVEFSVAEAVACLKETEGDFDILFCDIDKDAYFEAWKLMRKRVRPGGAVIFHNMMLGGGVMAEDRQTWLATVRRPRAPGDPEPDPEELLRRQNKRRASLEAVTAVTEAIQEDDDFIATLNPVSDGLTVAYRK